MRKLNTQRFILALVSIAGLVAAGVGIFLVLGWHISLGAVEVGLLTLLIQQLGAGKTTAFAWFYDGAADSPPPAVGTTTSTTSAQIAAAPVAAASPLASTIPTGTLDDPVAVTEVPKP